MRTVIGMAGLALLVAACPGPSGQGGVQTGPTQGGGGGTDTSAANTPEQMEELQRSTREGLRTALNRCYMEEMERKKDKKLTGNVTLQITVGTAERADQVSIGAHTLSGQAFDGCLLETVRSWEFPKLNSPITSSYTFEFSPAY